ncbi:hypothetical protein [Winslowiella iniecta]|uniref:Uncharacterized protein n=1 Tax=Winslowiella iniecta TaxID=1560201 RepID=A0A0L7T1T7_9GAMM|nr:hypothetical protein [Winslowiella iniecta]KOC89379.1 hypothetical protein NG42_12480 [Winslowiella iniecta]KOC93397.1 hypothetical protein NG43_10145 [Winslowiella iniecta]
MEMQHFIFFVKGKTVVPQSLDEAEAGEIIRSVLLQQFNISRLHIIARNNKEALDKFALISETAADDVLKEVVLC